MEFKKETGVHAVKRKILNLSQEQTIDSSITLPEYFPDIAHVLKCSMQAQLYTVQNQTGQITGEGAALLRVLYITEDGQIRCYEQSVPFSKTMEADLPEGCTVRLNAKAEYVNCRVSSPRNMVLHGALSLLAEAFIVENENLLSACTGGGIQVQTERISCDVLLDTAEKLFTLQETLELGEAKPAAAQILTADAAAEIQQVKLVNGKVLLKGTLNIKTLYLCAGETETTECMQHALPFSQIVEISGAEENAAAEVDLRVLALQITPKSEAGGELRLLHAEATLAASIDVYAKTDTAIVLDAYSTQYAIRAEEKQVQLSSLADRFTDSCLCRSELELTGCDVKEIVNVRCTDLSYTAAVSEGAVHISGTAKIEILYKTGTDAWGIADRSAAVEYVHSIGNTAGEAAVHAHAVLSGMDYLLHAAEHMEVRIELQTEVLVFSTVTRHLVSDITLLEEQKKEPNRAALTVYFANAQEKLWDIARNYNTTVDAILKENGLTQDVLTEKCTLLIPRV